MQAVEGGIVLSCVEGWTTSSLPWRDKLHLHLYSDSTALFVHFQCLKSIGESQFVISVSILRIAYMKMAEIVTYTVITFIGGNEDR